MAGGGAANRLVYPSPIVFEALQAQAKSCLIMLHGLGDSPWLRQLLCDEPPLNTPPAAAGAPPWRRFAGDSGQGWADVAPMLQPDLPQTKFIFPTAPIRPITINGGMRMTGWYDIADLDRIGSESQDAAAMHESRRYIDELLEQEVAGGIPSNSIVVGGFSQGGAMALMSLRSKHKLAGIVGLSCYLPLLEEKPIVSEENKDTPVLMCHGDCDQVVNYDFGKRSYEELQKEGVKVDFKTYQFMGHEACGEELMEMRDFLKACFSKAAGKL